MQRRRSQLVGQDSDGSEGEDQESTKNDWIQSFYVNFLNQTRPVVELTPHPTGQQQVLHPKTPAKWAVLSVMTTKRFLELHAVIRLLNNLSYVRSRSTILRAINRCEKFGLIERVGGKHKWHGWKLTERGHQLLNAPKTRQLVRGRAALKKLLPQDI